MIGYAILASVKRLGVAAMACMCLAALAQTPGKFVAAGSMTIPRSGHTATLLRDGRVLITGGHYYSALGKRTLLASAELYDPSTGTFTRTGDMTTSRMWHTATLLCDGRVLVAGGSPENTAFATSSEVYDPATGLFTKAGNMAVPHTSLHDATLLANGKVLITGGSTELYDPATDAFTLVGTTNNYGSGSTAILKDGRLLVPGIDGVSLYDTTGDSLKLIAKSPGSYAYQTTTVLANGKVLIAGGEGDAYDRTIQDASIYDPRRGNLQGTGLLLFSRDGHTATLLSGGHVLIVGGYDGDGYDTGVPVLWEGEEYDPSASRLPEPWLTFDCTTQPRCFPTGRC